MHIMNIEYIEVTILRQDSPESEPYQEVFQLPYRTRMNVIQFSWI